MRFNTDKINRRPEAVQLFTACIALRPDHAVSYGNRAACYIHLGQLEDTIADSRQAIRLKPDVEVGNANLGIALRKQGKPDEAIAVYREFIRLKPEHAGAYGEIIQTLREQGKLDEAIAECREVIRLKPELGCGYDYLGDALISKGELDRAITALKEAVRLGPANHADHHSHLGYALMSKGRLDEAIATFREAIHLQPDSDDAWHFLGHSLVTQGKPGEAVAAFRETIRLKPGLADVHNDLAWLLATCPDPKIRDFPKAVALARKAVELAPKVEAYWNTLGVAHYRAGDWTASVAALEKSMELGHGGGDFDWFFLAMSHWRLGHGDEARTWYEKAAAWMEKNQANDVEHIRLRAEAAGLLGLADLPADVFARPEAVR